MDEKLFFYLASVPVLGVLAQLLAWWSRLPSILLLLLFGVALGLVCNPDDLLEQLLQSDSGHVVHSDTEPTGAENASAEHVKESSSTIGAKILFPIVSLSVAVILFEGGLSLRFNEIRDSGGVVIRLVTVGAFVSWLLTAIAAWWILGLDYRVATLLGAILVVTGPTVVMPLMRYIRPNRRIGSIVKWEGIVIDPVGAILAVLVFEHLFHSLFDPSHTSYPILALLYSIVVGVGFGFLFSWVLTWSINHFLIPDFLHGVTFLATALGAFALSNYLQHESGLVTVTALGIFLANQKKVSIDHVIAFKENLGIFLISCLFIVLGSRLNPQVIWDLGLDGLLFLIAMIFVVRPASIFVSTLGSNLSFREQIFLSFLAPRGIVAAAVTSVFALKIGSLVYGEEAMRAIALDTEKLVPITFLVIVGTVAVYGLGAAPLARRLGLADSSPQGILFAGATEWIRELAKIINDNGIAAILVDTNYRNVSTAKMDGMKAYCVSILSDHVHEEANLSGIGRMLALTGNDEVNVLATHEYEHMFGRVNVYQLPPGKNREGIRPSLSDQLKARVLFHQDWNSEKFESAFEAGYRIKATQLTDEFLFEDFKAMYNDEFLVLMTIENQKNLKIATVKHPLEPKPGNLVIAFVKETSKIGS